MSGRADYVGMPSAWEDRVPKISGPRGFHGDAGDDNVLSTRLPYDGQYEFSFSPCSMWGNPGRVQICATHVY